MKKPVLLWNSLMNKTDDQLRQKALQIVNITSEMSEIAPPDTNIYLALTKIFNSIADFSQAMINYHARIKDAH
jgi:short-subunit dehydrogenase